MNWQLEKEQKIATPLVSPTHSKIVRMCHVVEEGCFTMTWLSFCVSWLSRCGHMSLGYLSNLIAAKISSQKEAGLEYTALHLEQSPPTCA